MSGRWGDWFKGLVAGCGLGLALLGCGGAAAQTRATAGAEAASEVLYHWSQLVGEEAMSFRAITQGAACPVLEVDNTRLTMREVRVMLADFPYRMCELRAPMQVVQVRWQGLVWPTLPAGHGDAPSVAVVGDTGCRISKVFAQACVKETWPWQTIADAVGGSDVDVVVHVGDYHYREFCNEAGCAHEALGMNWGSWRADWFEPSKGLMARKVLVLARGNHEDTGRAWQGWNGFLSPTPGVEFAQAYTAAWLARWGRWSALMVDNSTGSDVEVAPDQLAALRAELGAVRWTDETWWVMHRPLWQAGSAVVQGSVPSRDAFAPLLGKGSTLVVSGHSHLGQVIGFADGGPNQIIVGHSGTQLDPGVVDEQVRGEVVAGRPIAQRTNVAGFGWLKAHYEATLAQWRFSFIAQSGTVKRECRYGARGLVCD